MTRLLEVRRIQRRDRILSPARTALRKAMAAGFKEQGRRLLKALTAANLGLSEAGHFGILREAGSWQPVFDGGDSTGLFEEALTVAAEEALLTGSAAVIASLGLDYTFNLGNPRAVAYLEAHAAEAVTAIDETTRAELARLISQGINQGMSYQKIANGIRDRFDGFSGYRSKMVATYETGMGYETGSRSVISDMQNLGLEFQKSWLTVGDDRVSEDCAANEEEGWISADQPHDSGDDTPLAHPLCRCTEEYQRIPTPDATSEPGPAAWSMA